MSNHAKLAVTGETAGKNNFTLFMKTPLLGCYIQQEFLMHQKRKHVEILYLCFSIKLSALIVGK